MAESGAPRPKRLSNFAIDRSNFNYIWLDIKKDWTYAQIKEDIGEHQYASHGGLIIYGQPSSGSPNVFHSALTFGPLQYVFFMRLAWVEKLELKLLYPSFSTWCRSEIMKTKQTPLSFEEKKKYGLL